MFWGTCIKEVGMDGLLISAFSGLDTSEADTGTKRLGVLTTGEVGMEREMLLGPGASSLEEGGVVLVLVVLVVVVVVV